MLMSGTTVPLQLGSEEPWFTQEDLAHVHPYDAQMNGWRTMRDLLDAFAVIGSTSEDHTHGHYIAWWLWLANPGQTWRLIKGGGHEFPVRDSQRNSISLHFIQGCSV